MRRASAIPAVSMPSGRGASPKRSCRRSVGWGSAAAGRRPLALGRVSLWGRVIENIDGFRAQYAYPYDLELVGGDEQLAGALRARYAVDVTRAAES
jgi:hypothetical protein